MGAGVGAGSTAGVGADGSTTGAASGAAGVVALASIVVFVSISLSPLFFSTILQFSFDFFAKCL